MSGPRSARLAKSLADVRRRPARTAFVVAGVFLAVFGLTTINVTQDQLSAAFAFSVGSQADEPDLVLDIDGLHGVALTEFQSIADVKSVQDSTSLQTQWRVGRSPGHVDLQIVSYPDLGHVPLTPFELIAGREPGPGEIVMESGDQVVEPVAIGGLVIVETSQGTSSLLVVGISRTPGQDPATTGAYHGYMSGAGLRALPAYTDPVTAPPLAPLRIEHLSVKVGSIAELDATTHALGAALQSRGVTVLGASFPEPLTAQLGQVNGVFAMLRLLALMALAMSGLLVLNTVRTSVAEQTAVIGTMRALGATRATVLHDYLLTVAIYGLIATPLGLALGVAVGALLAGFLAQAIPLALGPLAVGPAVVLIGFAAGLGVPLASAVWPIWEGTRISVRDALAAHGVDPGPGRGRLGRLGTRLPWISQTTWLGLRSTFRRRGRALLTVVMVGAAGTTFFVVQTASASVTETVGRVWGDIRADVEVYASEPYADARAQLAAVPNIARMERFGVAGAQTSWGKVAVWGFEPDTQLYAYRLTSGRWLQLGDTNVALISDDVAVLTGLHAASRLTLTLGGRPMTFTVAGTIDEPVDSLGQIGAVVVPVTGLYELEGTPAGSASGYVNKILVQAQDHSPQAVGALAQQIDSVARTLVLGGSAARGQGMGPVFLIREDELLRHQRNFLVLYALLYGVALVVGAAGALGLSSTLMASVTERQREIGLLRSMGASSLRLAKVFWVEGASLGALAVLLSGLVGVPLAAAFVAVLSRLVIPIDFVIDPLAFGSMLAAVVVIVAFAGMAPALRASRVRVAALLRYE
ncbi:MAG: FtsX-like permease family protein [Candidatus Limnocylindrales bacterium]